MQKIEVSKILTIPVDCMIDPVIILINVHIKFVEETLYFEDIRSFSTLIIQMIKNPVQWNKIESTETIPVPNPCTQNSKMKIPKTL